VGWNVGIMLLIIEVAAAPEITVVPANSSVSLTGNFTLVMADADVVGTDESVGQTRHWLVNGVTLKNGTLDNFLLGFSLPVN
jgi:hypothetical protein